MTVEAGIATTQTRRGFLQQAAATAAISLVAGRNALGHCSGDKGNLVFVVGTHHYHPEASMPLLARECQRLGFRTTVVMPPGDPEQNHNGVGLPGLEALEQADAAVFFLRFLTLGDEQFGHLERYLKSGKPVVGLRTSTHAFRYPEDDPRAAWNYTFGRSVIGTHWLMHMHSETQCHGLEQAGKHPVLTGIGEEPFPSPGQLYITDLEPGCTPLVVGMGDMPRERVFSDRFGTRVVTKTESDIVAWTWENHYGARVFASTLGHPRDFGVPQIMRIVVNGIHWAAGCAVPDADTEIKTFDLPIGP